MAVSNFISPGIDNAESLNLDGEGFLASNNQRLRAHLGDLGSSMAA